jgi:hypothetical protein
MWRHIKRYLHRRPLLDRIADWLLILILLAAAVAVISIAWFFWLVSHLGD